MERSAYLDDGALASNLEDLTLSGLSVSKLDIDDLSVPRQGDQCEFVDGVALTWGT